MYCHVLPISRRTGFVLTEHRDLLMKAVGVLAGRMNMTSVSSQLSLTGIIQ